MRYIDCNKTEEHDGHIHTIPDTDSCSGMTLCGQVHHDAHDVKVQRQVWCHGVCNCGLRKEKHGPGAHK